MSPCIMKIGGGGYTRTKNSIRNSVVAVLFQVIALTIGFFSRKIFLDYLGTEILGLNSTASSLLGFLNIAELGIGGEVKILKRVPYQDMWKIYTISDYYLNLSKTEIFGMAIMEAVYYHTSVAAINAIGPSLTLKDMKGHKLCAGDEEITQWILGPSPAEADLAESAEKIVRNFSWNTTANAFLRLIKLQNGK